MVFNGHGWASNHASRYSRPTDHQASNHWQKWFQQMYTYIYIFIQSIYIYTSLSLGKFLKNIFSTDDLPKKSTPISYLGKRSLGTPSLGGGFIYFLFSTLLGEMIKFDEHIFRMGWFNHQPDQHKWISREILLTNPSAIYRLFWFQSMKEGPLVTSCLGYTGDCTKQLYGDYFINHKAPY